ncbi:hypothetical protein HK098_004411 [Nowakowskiella sp. JEL0407]|nr:hypothetical protein HK098_004411 [Nowakowskiella sp. JEL0407]
MLQCHARTCTTNNFPLKIEDAEVQTIDAEFNPNFIKRIINRLDWPALVAAAYMLGVAQLPQEPPTAEATNEQLEVIHNIVLRTKIQSGRMVCPNCTHVYPIVNGIPNMLLQDGEV